MVGEVVLSNETLSLYDGRAVIVIFREIEIPRAGEINSAALAGYSASTRFGSNQIVIRGQLSASPAAAAASNANITSRELTTASVTWSPDSWSTDGPVQSVDISEIVQEIVNLESWPADGPGDIALILTSSSLFASRRDLASFDHSSLGPPRLLIEWGETGSSASYPELMSIDDVTTSAPSQDLPAFGGSFTEVYGTRVTRITTDTNEFHHYSKNRAIIRDESGICLGLNRVRSTTSPYGVLYTIADGSGRDSRRPSNTNADKLFLTGTGGNINKLYSYSLSGGAGSLTLLADYSSEFAALNIGVGEGNISNDDKYVVLAARTASTWNWLILYDLELNEEVSRRSVSNLDWAGVSHLGGFIVVGLNTQEHIVYPRATFASASGLSLGSLGHGDFGRDTSGNEYFVAVDNPNRQLRGRNLTTETNEIYLQWPTAFSGHVSGRNILRPNHMYFTARKHFEGARDVVVSFQLTPIISPLCEVWCHTREPAGVSGSSNFEPAGSVSPDGTKIVFRSRMGGTSTDTATIMSYMVEMD